MEASVASLWRPLGEILIEWQLISEEQLDQALRVQQRTGRRLGEVLVDLELVPRDVLISVLLQQCGLENETQNGFGSGLLRELRRRGGAHGQTVPFQVVRDEPEPVQPEPPQPEAEVVVHAVPSPPSVEEPRRRWLRRKDDRARSEQSERAAAAFARLEEWTTELRREVDEMRRLLADAAR